MKSFPNIPTVSLIPQRVSGLCFSNFYTEKKKKVTYKHFDKNIFHLKNHCSSTGNMSFFSGCFLRLLLLLLVFSNFIIVYFVLFKCVYEWVCVCVSSSCLEFSEILRSVYNFIKLDKFSVFDFHNFFCLCLLS